MKTINLFVNYFNSKHPARQEELNFVLSKNINNKYIDNIYLFIDPGHTVPSELLTDKVTIKHTETRPTYADFFSCTKKFPDDINIIANIDIFFDDSIKFTVGMDRKEAYALRRYDITPNGTPVLFGGNNGGAHDAWVFNGTVNSVTDVNYTLGVLGGDNRLPFLLEKAGYDMKNPCGVIKIYHLHLQRDTYAPFQKEIIPPPYLLIADTEYSEASGVHVPNYDININSMIQTTLNGIYDSDQHVMSFFGLALGMRAKNMLELGVRSGDSAFPLMEASNILNAFLTLVDIEPPGDKFLKTVSDSSKCKFIHTDALSFLANEVEQKVYYDFVHIDDWHDGLHVAKELEYIAKLTDKKSIILLHDAMATCNPEYYTPTTQTGEFGHGGVYAALQELDTNIWEWSTLPVNNGLTLLRQI